MFATSPSTIMDSTTMGGPLKAAPPLLWRRPKAASIMVDGEVANIGKTYANMYRIFMYMYISHILISAGPSLEGHTAAGIESRSCSQLLIEVCYRLFSSCR